MWGPLVVSSGSCLTLRSGDLRVYVQRIEDEWLFSYLFSADNSCDAQEASFTSIDPENLAPDLEWNRLVSARDEGLELTPALPDRPLVIRPESPVSILPGRYAKFYVAVPVWLRFEAVLGKTRNVVFEVPLRLLSNTWFGDPGSGELCYSLDAPLKRSPEQLSVGSSNITCSLLVRNDSKEKLNFERICVHVENLSVFIDAEGLWTNEISVLFTGSDQISQIRIKNRPPEILSAPRKVTEPREEQDKNILRRSFSVIRQFTGI